MQLPSFDRYASARSSAADHRAVAANRLQSVRSQTSDNTQKLTASVRELPALPAKEIEALSNRKLDGADTPPPQTARQDAGVESLTTVALARSSQPGTAARTARAQQAVKAYRSQNNGAEGAAAQGVRPQAAQTPSSTRTDRPANGPQARAQEAREALRSAQAETLPA